MPQMRALVAHTNRACATQITVMLSRDAGIPKVLAVPSLRAMRRALASGDGPAIAVLEGKLLAPTAEVSPAELARECPGLVLVVHLQDPSRDEILRLLDQGVHGVLPGGAPWDIASRVLALAVAGFVFVPRKANRDQSPTPAGRAIASIGAFDPREAARAQNVLRLTQWQRDVLQLITEGQSNKSIAMHLGICERTVKHHVSAILQTMDFGCRSAAAAWQARRDRWFPEGEYPMPCPSDAA